MNLKRLLKISRPRFWIYEIGPYIIGVLAAAQSEHFIWLMPLTLIFFIFFTYPANIYIYGINDVYDYDTDKLNPKKISYESLVMPDEQKGLLKHIAFVTLPFVIFGFMFLSFQSLIFLFAFLFFAGFYSAKPIRAKARPGLDSIFSAGHYIATAVFSYVFVSDILEKPISWLTVLILSGAGMCWAIAMHAYSAVPDIKADSDAGLSTVATKLGKKYTVILCALLYILSGVLSFTYLGLISILLSTVYVLFMIISLRADEDKFFKIYKLFPLINTLSGMIIFFTLLIKAL
jgi:4-hydroxybenzoate polyprenyltransferase